MPKNLVLTVEVALVGFGTFETRPVDVPVHLVTKDADIRELVFKYGQNDFQPREQRSVSVGDILLLDGVRMPDTNFVSYQGNWIVESVGFKKITTVKEFWSHVCAEGGYMVGRLKGELDKFYAKRKEA